ncbi:hypothetical protein [Thauera butanivorans]|uniref:hypothetical protein n=1 Tax=Thauera butanivorans TaxID=86174 RepID=UPI0012F92399|nr:hypothetical protein [Thauera butanivorans]
MKSDHIIAALITAGLFSIIGYVLFQENPAPTLPPSATAPDTPAPALDIPPPPRYQAPAHRAEAYYTAPDQQQHSNGLYRCIVAGRTIYQDQPCQDGQQTTLSGTMSVVPRYPVQQAQRALNALNPEPSSPRVAMVGSSANEHPNCKELRKRIRQIDAQARQRSTQRLTDDRRRTRERMSELKCSSMD